MAERLEKDERTPRDPELRARIAKRVREARMRKGLTIKNVADAVGLTSGSINYWESGGSFPVPENLIRLQEVLGVSLDWLMGLREDEQDPDQVILLEALGMADELGRQLLQVAAQQIIGQASRAG